MTISAPTNTLQNDPVFIFDGYRFSADSGELALRYRFEGGPELIETIRFPAPVPIPLNDERLDAAGQAFQTIFLLAGVSYYKAHASSAMRFDALAPDSATAAFLQNVYTKGLAEFAFENGIDIRDRVHIQGTGATALATSLGLKDRALVPVGGGKDSIVSIEALKAAGKDITLFALGGTGGAAQPIADTIRVSGLPHIYVSRALSPELKKMNDSGALNGHVPITAILSAIATACAILYDFNAVILSNEHSASAPNISQDGWDVNHQYSKSLEFERDFAGYVKTHIAQDLQYFSLLRPLTEAAIAKRFATHGAYHGIFRSCNTAFRQDVMTRRSHWCCDCPKCRFVFLALAPFTDKDHLINIFGQNPLNEVSQTLGFQQLCGLADFKPFECVGEIAESKLLMEALSHDPAWANDANVLVCAEKTQQFAENYAALFAFKDDHLVPPQYFKVLA